MQQNSPGRTVMVQGRIVWVSGDLFKGRVKTDPNTRQPLLDAQGQQRVEFGFGLAVPKSVLSQMGKDQPGEIWDAIHKEAFSLYPSGQVPPGFAYKYKDGDGIDDKGRPFADREGYAGHLVFACTTSIPIKFFKWEGGGNQIINEGIKCGDYVNVQLTIKAHPAVGTSKAGLYLNPMAVQFLGYGKEIFNTPSGDSIFGNSMPAMPTGASAVPLAPQAGHLVSAPAAPQAPAFPPAAPAYAPPVAAPTPNYNVLPPQHQPGPAPAAPVPPGYAAPVPQAAPYVPPTAPQGFPVPPGFAPPSGFPPVPGR